MLLVASWILLGLANQWMPDFVVPNLWAIIIIAVLPTSFFLATVAAWKGSKWWLFVGGLGLLSEAFCLLSVAV